MTWIFHATAGEVVIISLVGIFIGLLYGIKVGAYFASKSPNGEEVIYCI